MSRGKRSSSLSRDAIVEEAIRIIAEEGLSGLTMRAVAARLGVTPMAAYYYVADKDELMRLVSERVSSSSGPLRMDPGEDWEDVLRTRLIKLWENSTRYPGLGTYLINQPDLGVTSDQLESGVRFFEDVGFSPKGARQAWSFAMTYIHGRISVDAHLAHKPQAPRMSGLRARDYVDFGVEAVIAGLRAMLAAGEDGQPVALDGASLRSARAARTGGRKAR
jgi:TetR/AcrR family transcriptional regulator, tetracycline repressor protein